MSRRHAFKTQFGTAIGGGHARQRDLCLVYRVTGPGTVEIDTVLVNGTRDDALWLLRQIEADAGLIAELIAKAAQDVADDAARAAPVMLARAA